MPGARDKGVVRAHSGRSKPEGGANPQASAAPSAAPSATESITGGTNGSRKPTSAARIPAASRGGSGASKRSGGAGAAVPQERTRLDDQLASVLAEELAPIVPGASSEASSPHRAADHPGDEEEDDAEATSHGAPPIAELAAGGRASSGPNRASPPALADDASIAGPLDFEQEATGDDVTGEIRVESDSTGPLELLPRGRERDGLPELEDDPFAERTNHQSDDPFSDSTNLGPVEAEDPFAERTVAADEDGTPLDLEAAGNGTGGPEIVASESPWDHIPADQALARPPSLTKARVERPAFPDESEPPFAAEVREDEDEDEFRLSGDVPDLDFEASTSGRASAPPATLAAIASSDLQAVPPTSDGPAIAVDSLPLDADETSLTGPEEALELISRAERADRADRALGPRDVDTRTSDDLSPAELPGGSGDLLSGARPALSVDAPLEDLEEPESPAERTVSQPLDDLGLDADPTAEPSKPGFFARFRGDSLPRKIKVKEVNRNRSAGTQPAAPPPPAGEPPASESPRPVSRSQSMAKPAAPARTTEPPPARTPAPRPTTSPGRTSDEEDEDVSGEGKKARRRANQPRLDSVPDFGQMQATASAVSKVIPLLIGVFVIFGVVLVAAVLGTKHRDNGASEHVTVRFLTVQDDPNHQDANPNLPAQPVVIETDPPVYVVQDSKILGTTPLTVESSVHGDRIGVELESPYYETWIGETTRNPTGEVRVHATLVRKKR